jgi:hypothetical protein
MHFIYSCYIYIAIVRYMGEILASCQGCFMTSQFGPFHKTLVLQI